MEFRNWALFSHFFVRDGLFCTQKKILQRRFLLEIRGDGLQTGLSWLKTRSGLKTGPDTGRVRLCILHNSGPGPLYFLICI